MNNSNNFNLCPRCGTANSLSAKYCYQCGSQLKVPEEPVVCPNCHTVNSGMANFCRACGSTLSVGAQTKICPRCKKEVPIGQNQCSCGYSFATVRYAEPAETAQPVKNKKQGKKAAAAEVAAPRKKGAARTLAIISLVLVVLTGYAIGFPRTLRGVNLRPLAFLDYLQLISGAGDGTVAGFVKGFIHGMDFAGISVAMWVVYSLAAIVTLALAAHFVCAIVRICTGKLQKSINWLYLVLAALTTIAVGLLILGNLPELSPALSFLRVFMLESGSLSYGLYVIPGYFWLFFLISLFARQRGGKRRKK